jgi:hypothetical protein
MKQATLVLTFLFMIAMASNVCQAQWIAGDYSVDSVHSTESISDATTAEAGHTTTPSSYVDTSGGTATSYITYIRTFTWDTQNDSFYIEGFSVKDTGIIGGYITSHDLSAPNATSTVIPGGGNSNGLNLTGATNIGEPDVTSYSGDSIELWTWYEVATNGLYTATAKIECDSYATDNEAHAQASGSIDNQ